MTNRSAARRPASRSTASSRAEARRRARLAGQDEAESPEEEPEASSASRPAGTGFLQRVFPAALPLKGKPDPLAGFRYEGRLRPVVVAGYLLRQNPVAWLGPGLVYVFSWELIYLVGGAGDVALLGLQLLQYVVIASAGWFGWQRPWLFGAAAGLVGSLGFTAVLIALYLAFGGGDRLHFSPTDLNLYLQMLFYAFLGAALGWYGGYIRRRLATPPPPAGTGARRR